MKLVYKLSYHISMHNTRTYIHTTYTHTHTHTHSCTHTHTHTYTKTRALTRVLTHECVIIGLLAHVHVRTIKLAVTNGIFMQAFGLSFITVFGVTLITSGHCMLSVIEFSRNQTLIANKRIQHRRNSYHEHFIVCTTSPEPSDKFKSAQLVNKALNNEPYNSSIALLLN